MSSYVRRPSRVRRAITVLALGTCVPVLGGCTDLPTLGESIDEATSHVSGVKLTPSRTSVESGESVVLDIAGSTLEDGKGTCPTVTYWYTDDEVGYDEESVPKTVRQGANACSVVEDRLTVRLVAPPSTPAGGTYKAKLGVTLVGPKTKEGINVTEMSQSDTTTTVDVRVPAAPAPTPVATPPAPAPQPPAAPAPTPPTDTGLKPVAVSCGATPVTPSGFTWGFLINPSDPVAGKAVAFDGSRTTSSEAAITRYDWDTDGDGMSDQHSTTPALSFTPSAAGTLKTCLQATDAKGRVATHAYTLEVKAAGYIAATPFTTSPSAPRVGQAVTFTPTARPANADFACVYFGTDDDGDTFEDYQCSASGPYTHTYTSAGDKVVTFRVIDTSTPGSDANSWSQYVGVTATRRATDARAAGGPAFSAATKKGKAVSLTTPLKTSGTIRSRGKVSLNSKGVATIKGAILSGRMRSTLGKSARAKVPAALRFLLDADFASSTTGKTVFLAPDTTGIAGTGKVLAQARNDRRTRICLSFKTDGKSQAGSTWKVLGATGRSKGYSGSGLVTPPVVGPAAPKTQATVTFRSGAKRTGVGSCAALAKYLPKRKK